MKILSCLLLATFLFSPLSFAEEIINTAAETKTQPLAEEKAAAVDRTLEAIEVLSGFSWADLKDQDTLNQVPLIVDLDLNLKPLLQKINFYPEQLAQFQLELFLAGISSPKANFETGVNFFLKAGVFPQSWKFQPYVKAGLGLDYMTLHTKEQSTQFNFIETGGAGAHYFFTENIAATVEYRFRHLSNSGIDHPNSGINSQAVVGGVTYHF
jgi:hypothetical protein